MRPSPDDNAIFFDARREARSLYWRGWSITQLSEELKLKRATAESLEAGGDPRPLPAVAQ